ncbi:DUF4331 domain-containing protein [Phenylobacterium sp.]|uniref:DUF4331 domain-containing protein n=1 Tax=Phenylobacterium sp. TaxID=1871053 RepID=UPI002ED9E4BA
MFRRYTWFATAAAVAVVSLGASPAGASSHREAPAVTRTPKVDSTDFYMFRSYEPGREGFVTLIANYVPLQAPYGGPNYVTMDPDAIYEIHVDSDGDAVEDLTFQFDFANTLPANGNGIVLNIGGKMNAIALRAAGPVTSPNDTDLGEQESFTVTLVRGDRRTGTRAAVTNAAGGAPSFLKPLDNVGTKTIPDYRAYARQFVYVINIPGCSTPGRMFVGQRAEAFAVNLGPVFDLVNFVPVEGDSAPGAKDGRGFPGGITQSRDNDDLVGEFNITSLIVEAPIACLTGSGNGVIGGWTTASLPQAILRRPTPSYDRPDQVGGAYVQVSRLSAPLVNEFFVGLKDKDKFSASEPRGDGQFADYVTNPTLPAILDSLFRAPVNQTLKTNIANLAPGNFPRNDLVAAFLTGFSGVNQQSRVTPSEMIRLNTGINPTPVARQSPFGVAGDDLAGFPNGRRPGDDVVDLALRVAMGRLCYPVPVNGVQTDLALCRPTDAPVGNVPFTDGAPLDARDPILQPTFPYLGDPLPGAGGSRR